MEKLNNRTIHPDIIIERSLYISGLLDAVSFLCSELRQQLINERRYLGITKSYMNSINESLVKLEDFNSKSEFEIDIFQKILYLIKPSIQQCFKKLRYKKLSKGDCCIIIIKKLLELISHQIQEVGKYKGNKEVRTLRKIINKFFENIKNKRKADSLFQLTQHITEAIERGVVGKHNLTDLELVDINIVIQNEILEQSGERFNNDSFNNNKLIEITWKNS